MRRRYHGPKKWAIYYPNKWGEKEKLKLTFIVVCFVPDPNFMTSYAFTLYSSSVLFTPLSFSGCGEKRKKKSPMRDLNKVLYKYHHE